LVYRVIGHWGDPGRRSDEYIGALPRRGGMFGEWAVTEVGNSSCIRGGLSVEG